MDLLHEDWVLFRQYKPLSDMQGVQWIRPVKYVKLAPAHLPYVTDTIAHDIVHSSTLGGVEKHFFQI